jgi:hypothetical protein
MTILPIVILALFCSVVFASRRLRSAAQPLRLKLAELGEALLADPNLPKLHASCVKEQMDTAFGDRAMLVIGIIIVPFMAALILVRPDWVFAQMRAQSIPNSETQAKFDEIMRLHDIITLANNPFLMLVFEFEMLLLIPLAFLIRALIQGLVFDHADRRSTVGLIEHTALRLRNQGTSRLTALHSAHPA